MIKQIKLNKIFINDQDRNGVAFITKSGKNPGKPYRKIAVKTDYQPDKYLYGWIFDDNDIRLKWKEGDSVSVAIEENNGYLNFKLPTKEDYIQQDIDELKVRLKNVEDFVLNPAQNSESKVELPVEDDLPF